MDTPHDLLLIDDHPFVRLALKSLLLESPAIRIIDEACDLKEGLSKTQAKPYALVLLDLDLPDCKGLETIEQFLACAPDTPVALLSGEDGFEMRTQALAMNIRGYIVKAQSPEVIRAAINLMLAGERYIPSDIYARLSVSPQQATESPPVLAPLNAEFERLCGQLTPRLQEVFTLVLQGRTNKEISQELGLTLGTVKNYVSGIFERLDLPSRPRAISHVMHIASAKKPPARARRPEA